MLRSLKERVLPMFMSALLHPIERLSPQERHAFDECLKDVPVAPGDHGTPTVIAMIGLVGSGKSTVAKALAKELGAIVIEADAIRVKLRKHGARFDHARLIAELLAMELVEQQQNVILDSDFIDDDKRASLRARFANNAARLQFVRVVCEFDIAMGRIVAIDPESRANEFFRGARSLWNAPNRGSVVRLREMMRRLPNHYAWYSAGGGRWSPRELPFRVDETINTSDEDVAAEAIRAYAKRLHRS